MTRVRDLDHAVDLFEGELARRGRTKATRRKYCVDVLYPFCEHCGQIAPWEVTADHCRTFLDRWINSSPATLALYVSILTRFFAFLEEEEIIEASPMARIKRPPLKRPEELDVTTISTTDVERLYAAAREWDEILCLALLTYLGPRRRAAAGIRRSDLDFERGSIRFREKGGKIITKPVPDELMAILLSADDAGVWGTPDAYVIPNRRAPRSKERSDKVVYAIVKRLAARAGVNVHPHALRAAFAVHYLETHPGDVDALQKLMGHTRMETTQVYLRRHDKFKAMERVRDLSWSSGASSSNASDRLAPASAGTDREDDGVAPVPRPGLLQPNAVFGEDALPEPLRLKLQALRARSSRERT